MSSTKKRSLENSTHCYGERNSMVALPMDIIKLILSKLDVVDFHCFRAVCRSWRSIAIAVKEKWPLNLQPQLPWLVLCSRASHPRFFSLSHSKTFRQKLVEARGTRCYGSSWGWLIMAGHERNIFLLNPFTRIQIQLPKEAIFPIASQNGHAIQGLYPRPSAHWLQDRKCIRKAMLLSPPTVALATPPSSNSHLVMPSPDCVVVVIDNHGSLSFCRLADKVWTDTVNYSYLDEHGLLDDEGYADFILYNGKVYAIDNGLDLVQVALGPCPKFTNCNIDIPPAISDTVYLVECLGELLMVTRCYDLFYYSDALHGTAHVETFKQTTNFEIFKLDTKGECWTLLENLGDQMLFVGSCNSYSVSALDYPGMRGNCIYFTESDGLLEKMPQDCNDTGVFYLEDRSFKRLFPDDEVFTFSQPVWFTPTSWWEEVPSGFLHGVEMRKCQ